MSIESYYTIGAEIGKGLTGRVFEATRKSDGEVFAVKIVNRGGLDDLLAEAVSNEISALKELDHPNIVKLVDLFDDSTRFFLVLEYVRGGELFARISRKTSYTEKEGRDLCRIILAAIQHCHSRDIVHRDLKCENLLMLNFESDSDVKIVDFGFSQKAPEPNLKGKMGTPIYMAPEIWNYEPYGKPVDMWAFGVITYILLGGYPPFADDDKNKLAKRITRAKFAFHEEYWSQVSPDAKDFITRLLTVKPTERMTVEDALIHPWLRIDERDLQANNLNSSLVQLKAFNARRKLKKTLHAILAVMKMKRLFAVTSGKTVSELCNSPVAALSRSNSHASGGASGTGGDDSADGDCTSNEVNTVTVIKHCL